jgi:hypothetical protein
MSFCYFYHFFQNELLASYHYYKETWPYTKYKLAYQIDDTELSYKVIALIGDFEVKPLSKPASIHIIL